MTCTCYCLTIEEIFDGMIGLSYKVMAENRGIVNSYINEVWSLVTVFVQSFKRDEVIVRAMFQPPTERVGAAHEFVSKFESYADAEEKRLLRNLEEIKYRIGGPDTLRVVSGDGRIEMVRKLVAMLFLVLIPDKHLRLDPFPDVYSYFEEGSGKDQSRSGTRSF